MSIKQNVPFLKRVGLTLDKLADSALATGVREVRDARSLSILMLNDVKMSECSRPSVPTAKGRLELLRVELEGDMLTIADVKGQCHKGTSNQVEALGARLYALKTVNMEGATAFMFLTEPPAACRTTSSSLPEGLRSSTTMGAAAHASSRHAASTATTDSA